MLQTGYFALLQLLWRLGPDEVICRHMLPYFQKARPGIAAAIMRSCATRRGWCHQPHGHAIGGAPESYAHAGKMIRGILVRLGYELCSAEAPGAVMDAVLNQAGRPWSFSGRSADP